MLSLFPSSVASVKLLLLIYLIWPTAFGCGLAAEWGVRLLLRHPERPAEPDEPDTGEARAEVGETEPPDHRRNHERTLLRRLPLALFETTIAKMRVFRVPEFLGAALMLGLLAALLRFVSRSL